MINKPALEVLPIEIVQTYEWSNFHKQLWEKIQPTLIDMGFDMDNLCVTSLIIADKIKLVGYQVNNKKTGER